MPGLLLLQPTMPISHTSMAYMPGLQSKSLAFYTYPPPPKITEGTAPRSWGLYQDIKEEC